MFLFPDLTLAMQKLYQTFVAQAAQLQSVHENVKVSFFYLMHCFENDILIKSQTISIS